MMNRLTRTVLRHQRLVAAAWVVLTLIGMGAAGPASEALDQRFSVPDREGWETSQEILQLYGNGGESPPIIPVVSLPEGTSASSPAVRTELRELEVLAQKTVRDSDPDSPLSRFPGGALGVATLVAAPALGALAAWALRMR